MKIETTAILRLRDDLLGPLGTPAVDAEPSPSLPPSEARDAALERVGPLAETMFLMMVADRESADEERQIIRQAIGVLTDGVLGPDSVDALLARFERALREQGREARLGQVGALLSGDRADAEAAFRLAAAVALADGDVAAEERSLVEKLAEWLGLSPKRAAAILEESRG